jgi:diguanylate cyclase (GGDEF)-like protein
MYIPFRRRSKAAFAAPKNSTSKASKGEIVKDASTLSVRSLMPSFQGNLLLAVFLVFAELVIAGFTRFALWPFILGAVLFLCAIYAVWRQKSHNSRAAVRGSNLICILLVMKVSFLLVAGTGGVLSNFTGILYVPIFLAALFYHIPGSLGVGATVALFLLLVNSSGRFASAGEIKETSFILSGVFLFVSLVAGIFSHNLTRSVRLATRRARLQQRRAAEFEWFMDTSMMMESLRELDAMLSAGLMRLQELLPGDTASIYLRETEGLQMELAQYASSRGVQPGRKLLSIDDQEPLRVAGFTVAYWPDTHQSRKEMGAFRHVQPEARSMMAVNLSTLDDVFGAVVVSTQEPNVFTERHRDLFLQFARHVVYPILRIRLHALATTDTLTGLNNHRAFRRRLQEEIERCQRYNHPLSMILIDLDHFKTVNDTQGHPAGDAILAQVGSMLRRGSRATDLVARYGGEEMVVLCPETRPDEAVILAERIRESVEKRVFDLPTGGDIRITVSLGIASLPDHSLDAETLIDAADRALYDAKTHGRNRVCVASPLKPVPTVPGKSR